MLHRFVLLGLVMGISGVSEANAEGPLPQSVPEAVGMSSERLQRLDATLQTEVESRRLPGAVVAIARRGKLVHLKAYGHRDPSSNDAMPLDGIFAIASMTKPLVGAAILMLQEEGKLSLNEPIERYIPELGQRRVAVMSDAVRAGEAPTESVPARRSITLLDLARHTSGITYGGRGATGVHKMFPSSSNWAGENLTSAELVKRLAAAPLLFQPGAVWDYGLSIDVLGIVVEKVSGKSLGAFLDERLFQPLGMKDTRFVVPAQDAGRLARALPNDPETGKPQTVPDRSLPLKFDCGGGCLASTAADYIRFAQMLLDGGVFDGKRILGRKSVELMTANHMTPDIDNRIAITDPNGVGPLVGRPARTFGRSLHGADPRRSAAAIPPYDQQPRIPSYS